MAGVLAVSAGADSAPAAEALAVSAGADSDHAAEAMVVSVGADSDQAAEVLAVPALALAAVVGRPPEVVSADDAKVCAFQRDHVDVLRRPLQLLPPSHSR